MFAIGFLIFGAIFLAGLSLASRLLPGGLRRPFFWTVLAFLFIYPFLHLVRPSYLAFKELCKAPPAATIIKTKSVDFILLDHGFSSDCKNGPTYIANSGYLGFDCVRMRSGEREIYRYTKKPDSDSACGLECFEVQRISKPEAVFGYFDNSSRTRAGYMAGKERRVTMDYPISRDEKPTPFWQWLRFTDSILRDETDGDMAFTTRFFYFPYGPITALGLASGSAPSEQCPLPPGVDPRDVYKPKLPAPASGSR